MKVYWLKPLESQAWLEPDQVVARLEAAFPRMLSNADTVRERGQRFISKYRALLASGLSRGNSPPLEVVKQRWEGALLV